MGAFLAVQARAQTPELLLYGDSDHKTALGCINCSNRDPNSICNKFGGNGSKFAPESIWNPFNNYGSKFSADSPWNRFSSEAPVIVDRDGSFYGRLTANKYLSDRTKIQALDQLTDIVASGTPLDEARDLFCGN